MLPSPGKGRHAAAPHLDAPNAFFEAFLDPRMGESSAYFPGEETDLATARLAQFDLVARKLRLRPYQTLLDVGCGWGGFVIHACKHYGVTAHGITPSPRQAEYAQEWIRREGLEDQALVECRDHRGLIGELQVDRISATGGLDQVGPRHLAQFFAGLHRLLRDNGLLLLQGPGRGREWRPNRVDDWFAHRLAPDSEPPSLSTVVTQLEDNAFEAQDVENLRRHYAKTCAHWVARLRENRDQCLRHVDEATYRTWLLYLGLNSVYLEEGRLFLYQILASKRSPRFAPLPLTREDLYG